MLFERLASPKQLRAEDLPQDEPLINQIERAQTHINDFIERDLRTRRSAYNEPGSVAPSSWVIEEEYRRLELELYDLELTSFFQAVNETYANPESPTIPLAVEKMYRLATGLARYQQEEVSNDLGEHYETWLETTLQTVPLMKDNPTQTNEISEILMKHLNHLNVTKEFNHLREILHQVLAPAVLAMAESQPPTTKAVAATSLYRQTS